MSIQPFRTALAALAGAAVLAAASPASAQQAPRVITFPEAVRIALAQNGELRLTENAAALDSVTVRQEKRDFLPDLRFSTSSSQSVGRNFNEDVGSAQNTSTRSLSAGVSSSVVLFDGFANVAEVRGAELAQRAGGLEVQRARQSVVFNVMSNFLALVEQQEQLRVQRENLTAQEAQAREIQAFVEAGVRPIANQYQQQANVAAARLAVVQAQRALELARVELIGTLQLDPRGDYHFQPPTAGTTAAAARTGAALPPLDSLLDRAFAQRADLEAREAELGSAEQGVRAARASRLPTITLTGGYDTGLSSASDFGFFDQLDQRRGGSLSVGVSVPVFDRGQAGAATQRARIQVENARIALENQRQQVGLEVRRAFLDVQAAEAQLGAAEAQAQAADQALRATQERYNAGAGTLVELTQARAAQVQAASALVNARTNLVFQRALVQYYVGALDPQAATLEAPAPAPAPTATQPSAGRE